MGRFSHRLDPDIPQSFYVLMGGRFVNLVGNSLVFPFMTIYLAARLHAPMTVVGLVMTLYGLAQVSAQLVGGILSDTWGRRRVMILSLTVGPLFTVAVGLAHNTWLLLLALVLMGMTVPLFQPASMAMVGDLVPSAKLPQAYSLMRMASNAGIIIGPMIGGFLADRSFFLIFFFDALSMLAYLGLILLFIRDVARHPGPTQAGAPTGLRGIARDRAFLWFASFWGVTGMVYTQLYQVVPFYLHVDLHDPASTFGYLAAENAVLVLALQWPITRLTHRASPTRLMSLGSLFYGFGFLVMSFSTHMVAFAASVLVITIGENIINPAASTWVAQRAPEHLRGRYMGLFGLANRTGSALGPTVGGGLLSLGAAVWLYATAAGGGLVSGSFWQFARWEQRAASLPPKEDSLAT